MKKISITLISLLLILSLTGCAKLVSTDTQVVNAIIKSTYHRAMWVQNVTTGKTITNIVHPAINQVTVEYKGKTYTMNNSEIYNRHKNEKGKTVSCTFEIKTYDNGDIYYRLINID